MTPVTAVLAEACLAAAVEAAAAAAPVRIRKAVAQVVTGVCMGMPPSAHMHQPMGDMSHQMRHAEMLCLGTEISEACC